MHKKAEISGFGWLVMAAVAVLIGLSFWTLLGENIGAMTKTYTQVNKTMTMPSGVATEMTMCGQKALTTTILNATDNVTIAAGNYTITQAKGTDGYLAAFINNASIEFDGFSVRVTCNYEPDGYINDGGSRAVISLIAIMMAILILVSAMPDLRNGVIDFIKGK